jgi:outer membrane lipoprotein carrier protein
MLTRLLVTMLVSQVPEGNPIALSAKKATSARDAGVKTTLAKPDAGVADAGVAVVADAGVTVAPKPVMAPEVKTLVDRMQAFYESTRDFTADFKQDYFYKLSKRTQTSTGTVVFAKPGLMRWEYLKPSLRTFVLAGVKVYMHDPEAKLLTVASLGTSKLSASVTFLFGQGKLADEFAITQKACETCAGTLLQLDPLVPDARFTRILLEVDPKTAQVLKSTVIDPDGSENAIAFLNLKTNVLPGFDGGSGSVDPRFKLTPPPGTQVQDFTMGVGAQPKP